jgi:hypothetical protein
MLSKTAGAGRRPKGSGSAAFWNASRRQFEAKVTLGDGTRHTVRAATLDEVEERRDALARHANGDRAHYPKVDIEVVHVLVRMILEDKRLLRAIASSLRQLALEETVNGRAGHQPDSADADRVELAAGH